MKYKKRFLIILSIVILVMFSFLLIRTGFLQGSRIDKRDMAFWNYTPEGLIENAEEFYLDGKNETCWILVHSYTSTPHEMRELSSRISHEFGDYILVPRLKGHGEVPSKITELSLEDWHNQILEDYKNLKINCSNINLVGSSIGAGIVIKIAEENEVKNLYLINPYLQPSYHFYYISNLNFYLKNFGPFLEYSKKRRLAQIADEEGIKDHIAYWNMPFRPMSNSIDFFEEIKTNLEKLDSPTLIQQSINDKTSSIKSGEIINDSITSQTKEFIKFNQSNHVLLKDYDSKETIENIIKFENANR